MSSWQMICVQDQDSGCVILTRMTNSFVSRGGIKLQAALESFKVHVKDKVVLDVGSSTGGFVDCLLQNGAKKIYSVDTSYGELAWKLRKDPKVIVMERTNILYLEKLPSVIAKQEAGGLIPARRYEIASPLGGKEGIQSDSSSSGSPIGVGDDNIKVDLVTIDAGWTKLELVLPVVRKFLKESGEIIALLKPHYEAEKHELNNGKLVEEVALKVKEKVKQKILNLGFKITEEVISPILGKGGNIEYFFILRRIRNSRSGIPAGR